MFKLKIYLKIKFNLLFFNLSKIYFKNQLLSIKFLLKKMKFNHYLLLMIKKKKKKNHYKKRRNKITSNLVRIYQIYCKKWILKMKIKKVRLIQYLLKYYYY